MPSGIPPNIMAVLTSSYHLFTFEPMAVELLAYRLIKAERRLVFDILYQHKDTRWWGEDDGDYPIFTASNGYQVISRSRMDIQTERLWLLGANTTDPRSGTMVFGDNDKRDAAFLGFQSALNEWATAQVVGLENFEEL